MLVNSLKLRKKSFRILLRTIVLVTKESSLEPKTWEVILMFLLHVTDILLAPPLVNDHLGPAYNIIRVFVMSFCKRRTF